jgi:LuxR family maltose regulon positive regulatory protein
MRGARLRGLIRLGETDRVEQSFGEMDRDLRATPEMRVILAELRLAQDDPAGVAAAVAPIVDRAIAVPAPIFEIQALLLEAIARDALRDPGAASRALERALDLAEPGGLVFPFLLHPAPELLARHPRHRTAHGKLLDDILDVQRGRLSVQDRSGDELAEPLTASEQRVLGYLASNLSTGEIGSELYLSINTIKVHLRHIYAKLGVHSRTEAVERARELRLIAGGRRH